ncbi:hypothetical protein QQP08_021959 [Theobroma cacao]|nr:hypothetical protein QQP08_021959 [Theobroma cacao]
MAVDGGGRLWWRQGRPEMGLEGDFAGIVVVAGGWKLQQGGVVCKIFPTLSDATFSATSKTLGRGSVTAASKSAAQDLSASCTLSARGKHQACIFFGDSPSESLSLCQCNDEDDHWLEQQPMSIEGRRASSRTGPPQHKP